MKKFESNQDITAEKKLLHDFCTYYKYEGTKLPQWEIDYLVHRQGKAIGFVEIKNYTSTFDKYDRGMLSLIKLNKMISSHKYLPTLLLMSWACGTKGWIGLDDIKGEIKWGGRKPRDGSANDMEFVIYFPKTSVLLF